MESDVSPPSDQDLERLRRAQWSERDPEGRAFAAIAEAHRLRGELHLAKTVAQEGVDRLPEFASGHVAAGLVHRALGSPVEADVAFRRVLELDPENTVALQSLGELAEERDSHAEAAEYFRQVQLLDPGARDHAPGPEALDLGVAEADKAPDSEPAELPPLEEAAAQPSLESAASTSQEAESPPTQEAGSPPLEEAHSPLPVADLAPEEGSFEFSVADLDDVFKAPEFQVQESRDGAETVAPIDLPDGDLEDATLLEDRNVFDDRALAPPDLAEGVPETPEAESATPDGNTAAPEWSWSPAPESEAESPRLPVQDLAPDRPSASHTEADEETLVMPIADLAPDALHPPAQLSPPEPAVTPAEDQAEEAGSISVTELAPESPLEDSPAPDSTILPVGRLAPDEGETDAMDAGSGSASPEGAAPGDGDESDAPAEDDFQAWLERNSL